jgi:hypothetical protein
MFKTYKYIFLSDFGFDENNKDTPKHIKKNIKKIKKNIYKSIKHKEKSYESTELLLGGDLVYFNYNKEIIVYIYNKFLDECIIKNENIHSILGNHDYYVCPEMFIKNKLFNIQDWFYSYNPGNGLKFFFIDTMLIKPDEPDVGYEIICKSRNIDFTTKQEAYEICIKLRNRMLNWLDKKLENSKNTFNIIIGHYPIYTLGVYSDMNPTMLYYLYPLFKKHNVRLYLSGHEHNTQHIEINKEEDKNYNLHVLIAGGSLEIRDKLNKELQIKDNRNIILHYGNFIENLTLKLKYCINKENNKEKKILIMFKDTANKNKIKYKFELSI